MDDDTEKARPFSSVWIISCGSATDAGELRRTLDRAAAVRARLRRGASADIGQELLNLRWGDPSSSQLGAMRSEPIALGNKSDT